MNEAVFVAPDIVCEGCAGSIQRALGRIAGVDTVEVDVPARRVTVAFDPAQTSSAKLQEALERAGFPASAQAE